MITEPVSAVATPLEIARGLAPRIRKRAAEIEAARQLPPDLVMDIANARLFRVALPEAEGGLGADILTTLQVIEEIARADGSTGWCLAMGINTLRQSAQFGPEVRRQIFFSDPIGISAGSANPRGRAVAAPGGYRVTGHWFFASGCMHSSALHGACKVFDGDKPRLRPNGDQEVRIAYFYPKSVARIIDTWDVSGLRGTGSHDIEVNDLFVPDERTFSALDLRARVTGPMNRMHGFDLAGCGFCCVGLGVARAAIDEFVELAQIKIPRSSSELLRDRAIVQARIGEAEAVLRSGRALLFDIVERHVGDRARRAADHRAAARRPAPGDDPCRAERRPGHAHGVRGRRHHVDLHEEPARAFRARRRGRHPPQSAAVRELRGGRAHGARPRIEQPAVLGRRERRDAADPRRDP